MNEKINELRFDVHSAQDFFSRMLAFTLGPSQLKELMEHQDVVVIDVRKTEDFNAGHLPGAISIPKEDIAQNTDKLSKEKLTVVYGCNEYCSGAAIGCLTLADYGYPCVMMRGGFRAWSEFYRYATVTD